MVSILSSHCNDISSEGIAGSSGSSQRKRKLEVESPLTDHRPKARRVELSDDTHNIAMSSHKDGTTTRRRGTPHPAAQSLDGNTWSENSATYTGHTADSSIGEITLSKSREFLSEDSCPLTYSTSPSQLAAARAYLDSTEDRKWSSPLVRQGICWEL